ncbi:MAG: hypothetical protein GX859_05940 [Corynebacterium humireducens]|jgi:hypothetical protein|uniref:Uncharacterized protein n=1 Tax=Corynebacterium humireducens TaxID=1223514 RepID=A0A7X6PMQ8_9CORY|nr:hypothetical protein [Corynebacterium humireducens]
MSSAWDKAVVEGEMVTINPYAGLSPFEKATLRNDVARLRNLGWSREVTVDGWTLTAPAEIQPGAPGSVLSRVRQIVERPSEMWDRAVVDDERAVTIQADENPFVNAGLEANLAQLQAAGWAVGSTESPRGKVAYTIIAPLERPAPESLREALSQVPSASQRGSEWINEATERNGALTFVLDAVSQYAFNSARAISSRARAEGWDVAEVTSPRGLVRLDFHPPKGLIKS